MLARLWRQKHAPTKILADHSAPALEPAFHWSTRTSQTLVPVLVHLFSHRALAAAMPVPPSVTCHARPRRRELGARDAVQPGIALGHCLLSWETARVTAQTCTAPWRNASPTFAGRAWGGLDSNLSASIVGSGHAGPRPAGRTSTASAAPAARCLSCCCTAEKV